MGPQEEEMNDEERMPENMTEFTVRVLKKGTTSGLFVDASTLDTSYEFNTLNYSENVNELYDSFISQRSVDTYSGPQFNSLDERLQAEFTDFMTGLGINEQLMSFINVMSVDKDQRLYTNWLRNM